VKRVLLLLIGTFVVTSLACGFNFSTANISEATMAKDPDGNEPTTTFNQDDIFYAVVELSNASDSTTVKASWVAVEVEGVDPGQVIDEVDLTSGSGQFKFDLSNDKLWPTGSYKVDLYLNDELDRSLPFEVVGEAVAEAPPEEEQPEPTEEPTPEPTVAEPEETEPTATPESSTGDTLGLGSQEEPTAAPVEEPDSSTSTVGPLTLRPDPYIHPSDAFEVGVPETWELYAEDELSAEFGDNRTRYGVIFINPGSVLNAKQMAELADNSVGIIIDTFGDNYEVIAENNQTDENGLHYVATSFNDEEGLADFFFEQHDTIVYIFYFASLDYDETKPTRDAILDTYKIDVNAALEALPAEGASEPEPAPSPTPVPQAQPANPFQPPAGVARVFMQNEYGSEYNVDFGDGSGSIAVMPGAQNFYHDVTPGKYNPGLSLPGGGATNVEFDIQPNQAYLILVTGDLGVKWGQVYP
jgi:hypothetical protein